MRKKISQTLQDSYTSLHYIRALKPPASHHTALALLQKEKRKRKRKIHTTLNPLHDNTIGKINERMMIFNL